MINSSVIVFINNVHYYNYVDHISHIKDLFIRIDQGKGSEIEYKM